MGTSALPINLDDDTPFVENNWIGQRKKYTDVPAFVRWKHDKDLEIPPTSIKCANFPEPDLTVNEFITFNLPRISSEIISNKVGMWFSKDAPNILNAQTVIDRSVPSPVFLNRLKEAAGQAWLDGAKSIIDWRFNDGADRLPLWIITFWKEVKRLTKIQSAWNQSLKWLLLAETRKRQDGKPALPSDLIQKARKSLQSLRWNATMAYCRRTTLTSQLSHFLGTFWLSNDHINMMVEEMLLDMHAERPEDLKYIQVASLSFARELRAVEEKLALPFSARQKTLLHKYELLVKEDGLQKLYFPVHVTENHWIVGMVNFKKKSIAFADSLYALNKSSGAPTKFITALQTWLKYAFGKQFKSFGNSLDHVVQDDTYSCGIITANTIEHAVLNRPLCHSKCATEERLKWRGYMQNASYQAQKALTIADLLNPINTDQHSEHSAMNDYDSDSSSEREVLCDVPNTSQNTYIPKPGGNGLERERVESVVESDTDSSDGYESSTISISANEGKQKKKYIKAGEGTSRSATASRIRREKLRNGTLKIEEWRYEAWKKKVLKDDSKATFHPQDKFRPRHSSCGKYVRMKDPCNIGRWNVHIESCKAEKSKKRAGGTPTLFQMGWAKVTKKQKVSNDSEDDDSEGESEPELDEVPCPGITVLDDPRVLQYLKRTGASGGGGRSLPVIAKGLFRKLFSELSRDKNRKVVVDTQMQEWKWKNDHVNHRVYATCCQQRVTDRSPKPPHPCPACGIVLRSRAFKSAIRKPIPTDKASKFVNHRFRNPLLGSIFARTIGVREIVEDENATSSPFVRYAQGALSGKYNNEVFNGLVQAMVTKHEREERGVGLQNFQYAPAWEEMSHLLRIHSPRAYCALKEYFPMPDERTIRKKEAREPCFPMDICLQTFELVDDHLKALDYDGPLGLSCDDTKLFATFRLYWDSKEKAHFLVGGVDGPIRVADPENIKQVIRDAKAEKRRQQNPIILTALPIPNSMDAPALCILLQKVVDGLIDRGLTIVSYACDGTKVERAVERLFLNLCSQRHFTIQNPRPGCKDTVITYGIYRGQAICMVQDSKHACKTLRNNLFSGARLLVLGNYPAMYSHILHVAQGNGTPLYSRDVTKLDRQDDNAAVRLFSADILKYLADNHPDYVGEIVYLFVFGEVIDAYQNRNMPHLERIKLVLRARYFLDSWEAFLIASGYRKDRYFISREAADILHFMIGGLIALIVACEHAFGEARHVVKDFTFLDFIYMIPKLRVKLHEAVLRGKSSNPKACASGYSHTYFDHEGLDLVALSTYPSDAEIELASQSAAEEANSLIALLGVNVSTLHHNQSASTWLPSVSSWLDNSHANPNSDVSDHDSDDDSDDDDKESEAQQLQDLLDQEESSSITRTRRVDERCLNLTSAALALAADEAAIVQQFSVTDEDELEEVVSDEYPRIQELSRLQNLSIPAVLLADEPSRPLGHSSVQYGDLDFDMLIDMRRQHQTKQAATGVRTKKFKEQSDHETTMRGKIIRELHETLKEAQDDIAIGTGVNRKVRWTDNRVPAPGGREGIVGGVAAPEVSAGNSANAALAAASVAKKAAERRKHIFTKAGVPNFAELKDARVTMLRPLQVGDYGVIVNPSGVMVGRVIALYSKTGGKNGKHSWINESSTIAAISYMAVQVFEHMHAQQFRSVPAATAIFQTRQFLQLSSINFLTLLDYKEEQSSTLKLSPEDLHRFRTLQNADKQLQAALKLSQKQGGNSDSED
ncbi:hypothetical protein B0H34DRAFT_854442 [Crassisporium funariophilum]|nr:hypothetical protein B0H34DRAFT_854442 [Crassisporium funariophilum]